MKYKENKIMRYWLPLIVYCLLIIGQSALPIHAPQIYNADKYLHFIVYCILGALLFRAFASLSISLSTLMTTIATVVVSCVIALGDELHQIFVPARTVDRADVFFDLAGSVAGIGLYILLRRYRKYLEANRS